MHSIHGAETFQSSFDLQSKYIIYKLHYTLDHLRVKTRNKMHRGTMEKSVSGEERQ